MSTRALERVHGWQLGTGIAAQVLGDIAEHCNDSLKCRTTAAEIAERLHLKPSSVELILFLAANQRRVTALVGQNGVIGYQLLDGKEDVQPTHLRDLPYEEYLQTGHWQELRQLKLTEADYRCQVCYGNESLQVHHRTYIRRGEELLSDLIVLCCECHTLFHEHRKLTR